MKFLIILTLLLSGCFTSKLEHTGTANKPIAANFETVDVDNDGVITQDEYIAEQGMSNTWDPIVVFTCILTGTALVIFILTWSTKQKTRT